MCTSEDTIQSFGSLITAGHTRRAVARRLDGGSLVRVRRGVYADSTVCAARLMAAAHGGPLACVAAARHIGIWVLPADDVVHVWLGGHSRAFRHDGCACIAHGDEGPRNGFAIPAVPRVLRQILRCRGVEEFFVALESALRQGLITRAGVAWLRAHTNDAAREAIALARSDADSGLESLIRWRLRGRCLRLRSQVAIVSVGIVDFLIGDRLIVEVDGRANHDGPSHRHRDLERDANAASWGYVTLRFDYAMVVHDWPTVELAILGAIDHGWHLSR